MRVSDAEREHVVGLLQKAIGRGMLDLDEFTERTDIALAARNRGQLNAVLADLPGLTHRDAVPVQQYAQPAYPDPAGYPPPPPAPRQWGSGQHLELKSHGSTLKRSGRWLVPPHVSVRNKYGETKLDFTEAQVLEPVVQVDLDTKWGSVELVIPEGAAVDVNAINEIKWGSLEDKTNTNGYAGTPRFVLTGRVHGGSLTIRHPRRGFFG
nr:DUF1707 domain-containing protein [Amycolatopsis antarctica]